MAPNFRTGDGQLQEDLKDATLLQCVLLADPFGAEQSWGSLVNQEDDELESSDRLPWCLLPLLGRPLLLWTLHSLALGGVQQVYLLVRDGIDKISSYLATDTTFLNPDASMSVKIVPTTAYSQGDVLREVDSRALLKTKTGGGCDIGTFILAQCGYIGNLDLDMASQKFTSSRKDSGGLLCLSAVMESQPDRLNSTNSTSVHLLDPDSRLHYFQSARHKFPAPRRVHVPAELFSQPRDLLLRVDLETVGLDICSVEVPQLFTENFDYQQIRPDFVHGILTSDLLGKTINCEVIKEGTNLGHSANWAMLVANVKSYDKASKDILSRRSEPLVLESARSEEPPPFSVRRGMIYIGQDVDLAKECKIGNGSCLGPGSTVSDNAIISQASIGPSTRVGCFSQVTKSHLFGNVTIGANTIIKNAIIGNNVTIKNDCVIQDGCLIGDGVVIAEGTQLISVSVGLTGPKGSCQLQGLGSQGVVWPRIGDDCPQPTKSNADSDTGSDSEEDQIDPRNLIFSRLGLWFHIDKISSPYTAKHDVIFECTGSTYPTSGLNSRASSTTSLSSLPSVASSSRSTQIQNLASIGEVGATADFVVECIRSLERAFEEDHTVENASIELKTLRMASNVSQPRFRCVVLEQICDLVHREPAKLKKWGSLMTHIMGTEENLEDMAVVLLDLQKWCSEYLGEDKVKFFSKILQYFYNEDVVSEEGITRWFTSQQSKVVGGSEGSKIREVGGKFLQMLMEAEEETSEDE